MTEPPLIVSMSARATSARTAGQPWLRPSRPSLRAVSRLTYGRAVNDDGAVEGVVVDAAVEPVQPQ